MFGHQDASNQNANDQYDQNNQQPDGMLTHHDDPATAPVPQAQAVDNVIGDVPQADAISSSASDYIVTAPQSQGSTMLPAADTPAAPTAPVATVGVTAGSDDLVGLKQKALQQLSPLVDHLDQTPEEKFRTTMMMIQASDDQSLLKTAYEAANQIPDEKVRAQALLDVVNEINYFTQQQDA